MALDPGELRNRSGERHRAHLESANIIEAIVLERVIGQFRQQGGALGIEHGGLEIEVEIALASGSQGDFAAAERALANDLGEAGTGG